MDTKSFAPYKFDATAWNRTSVSEHSGVPGPCTAENRKKCGWSEFCKHSDTTHCTFEEKDVCQFLVLGSEAVSFMQDIFPEYPKYKADKNCTFRFVICDDVSAYYDYLDKRLVDNKVEYTPGEFVLDLNGMTNEAEKLKSRWKHYVILMGDKNRQKETLALLLRSFDRHILHGDRIFNFYDGDLRWFLSSGVYLDAKVVKGSVVKESVRMDLIKAVRQDDVESMIIAFYQPMVKDWSCHWTQEMLTDILANMGKVVDACVCENLKCAFMEYGTEEPETIVLSMHHRMETTKKNYSANAMNIVLQDK